MSGASAPALALAAALAAAAPAAAAVETLALRPVRAAAAPSAGSWRGCAVLLEGSVAGPEPQRLLILCLGPSGAEVTPLAPAPRESAALAVELGPGGGLRILIGRPGGIDQLDVPTLSSAPMLRSVLEDERLHPDSLDDRPDLDGDGSPDLLQGTYAGLAAWRRASDGRFVPLQGAALAPEAGLSPESLAVFGKTILVPEPAALERWTAPRVAPGRRLSIDRAPLSAAGAGAPCTAWIDAPEPLWVRSAVILSGAQPRLAALVGRLGRITFLDNARLLVAPLVCDDTARGRPPELFVKTAVDENRRGDVLARDVTGDGLTDLIVHGVEGVFADKARLAVYAGLPGGGFARRPWARVLPGLAPRDLRWERDLNGDGVLDLLIVAPHQLVLAPGRASEVRGEAPVDWARRREFDLPSDLEAEGLAAFVDLGEASGIAALVSARQVAEEGKRQQEKRVTLVLGKQRAPPERDARLVVVRF